jgi:hypothetical protein
MIELGVRLSAILEEGTWWEVAALGQERFLGLGMALDLR